MVHQTLGPATPVVSAHDRASVDRLAAPGHVLLVNRVLDGDFHASGGVDLIRQLAQQPDPPTLLLISDYADAQEQAQAAGARPGFGKSQVGQPQAADRLRQACKG
jgi:CheY-like chemotaxis protein